MKFRIALVDDDSVVLKKEDEKIECILKELKIPAELKMYLSAEDFLYDYEEKPFSLYIFDIRMNGLGGFELGKIVRRQDADVPIMFLTDHKEYAVDGYELGVYRYLLKSDYEEKLRKILPELYGNWKRLNEGVYQANSSGYKYSISYRDILYIDTDGRYVTIHTFQQNLYERRPLKDVFAELDCGLFAQVRKDCIVNLENAVRFGNDDIYMKDGVCQKINRRYKPGYQQTLKEYLG